MIGRFRLYFKAVSGRVIILAKGLEEKIGIAVWKLVKRETN